MTEPQFGQRRGTYNLFITIQVAVSLSLANGDASLPVAYRLYLPQSWVNDAERRAKVGVPKDVDFRTKPQIALEQIKWACEADLPRGAW